DDLGGRNVQVQLRHPEIAGGDNQQTAGDEPPGVRASAQENADDKNRDNGENPGRRQDQPGMESIVAKERFQHRRQQGARSVKHSEGAENNEAGNGKVPVAERSEIHDWASVPRFPKDQAASAENEQG